MAQQIINIGTIANDGTGDTLRDGGDKINDNFTELYAGLTGLLDLKGTTDASANPNYPAASKGDFYVVSVAGKIGGGSGTDVEVGDAYYALADNAGGTQAAVGTSWSIIQGNTTGAGSVASLDDVGDVNAPTPAAGDVLTWDDTPGEWIPQAPAGAGAFVLDDATDVNAAAPSNGDVLTWDSTPGEWIPQAPTGSSTASAQYEDQKAANTSGGASVAGAWYGRSLNTEVYDSIGLSLRSATFTVTIATPGLFTWTSHGLVAGTAIVFTTTGALPTGLTAGTTYWVIAAGLTANDFQVSATQGGAAVNTSGSQSGTHTATASVISLAAGTYEVESESALYDAAMVRTRIRDITNSVTLALSTNYQADASQQVSAQSHIFSRFTLAGTALIQLEYRVGSAAATNGLGVLSNWGEVEIYSRLKLTKLS